MSDVNQTTDKEDLPQAYNFQIKLLGHELFQMQLDTSSSRGRWTAVTFLSIFATIIILGAYGDKFVDMYHRIVDGDTPVTQTQQQ